ncbi:MAG: hypothetical protein KBG85_13175 [Micropruina sp.]|nr:hypothetical protein [Micropruina sp.]
MTRDLSRLGRSSAFEIPAFAGMTGALLDDGLPGTTAFEIPAFAGMTVLFRMPGTTAFVSRSRRSPG